MTILDAVERVLLNMGTAMHYKDIARQLLQDQRWKPSAGGAGATVNAQIVLDVKKFGKRSRFQRTGPGVFGLRDWGIDEYSSELSDELLVEDAEVDTTVRLTDEYANTSEERQNPLEPEHRPYLPAGKERRKDQRRRAQRRREREIAHEKAAAESAALASEQEAMERRHDRDRRADDRRKEQVYVSSALVSGHAHCSVPAAPNPVNRRAVVSHDEPSPEAPPIVVPPIVAPPHPVTSSGSSGAAASAGWESSSEWELEEEKAPEVTVAATQTAAFSVADPPAQRFESASDASMEGAAGSALAEEPGEESPSGVPLAVVSTEEPHVEEAEAEVIPGVPLVEELEVEVILEEPSVEELEVTVCPEEPSVGEPDLPSTEATVEPSPETAMEAEAHLAPTTEASPPAAVAEEEVPVFLPVQTEPAPIKKVAVADAVEPASQDLRLGDPSPPPVWTMPKVSKAKGEPVPPAPIEQLGGKGGDSEVRMDRFPRIPPFAEVVASILRAQATREPLHYTEVASQACRMGWLSSAGPAEAAAMYAVAREEVALERRQGRVPRFVTPGGGYIGLSEWQSADVSVQVEAHNREVQGKLLYYLRMMELDAFEGVMGRLLAELGVSCLQVMERDGSGGFAALGHYRTPFGFTVPLALMIHRGREGASAMVTGWAAKVPPSAYGVIVSTESFSPDFAARVQRLGVKKVRLVNGHQLVNLLISRSLGVVREGTEILRLVVPRVDE